MNHKGLIPARRSDYLPNGVDMTRISPLRQQREQLRQQLAIPDDVFLWVSIGRLSYEKGADLLIDAASQLALPDPWQVHIVGDGELREPLQAQIERRGVSQQVKLCGALSYQETLEVLAAADAFVLPSRYENAPLALLEAISLYIPSVVTPVGDCPMLAYPSNSALRNMSLAESMQHVMTDSTTYNNLKAWCHETGDAHALDNMIDGMRKVYEEVSAS